MYLNGFSGSDHLQTDPFRQKLQGRLGAAYVCQQRSADYLASPGEADLDIRCASIR